VLLAAAVQAGAVDERIHHRVGHPEEKYPDEISVVDMRSIHERVDDECHLANAGANNDIVKSALGIYTVSLSPTPMIKGHLLFHTNTAFFRRADYSVRSEKRSYQFNVLCYLTTRSKTLVQKT